MDKLIGKYEILLTGEKIEVINDKDDKINYIKNGKVFVLAKTSFMEILKTLRKID